MSHDLFKFYYNLDPIIILLELKGKIQIKGNYMPYECVLKELPSQNTITIRTRSAVQKLPIILEESFREVFQYLEQINENPTGHPFVIFYNLDLNDLDIEIGFPVSKKLMDKENKKANKINAGKFATMLFTGPYERMEPAYDAINDWIKDNGYESLGPVIEFYLNDPREVGPENTQTEIRIPLK